MEWPGFEPATLRTEGEYANHYTVEAGLSSPIFSFFLNGSVYYIHYIVLLYILRALAFGINNRSDLGIE